MTTTKISKFEATLPDGTVVTRKTKGRTYTNVIAVVNRSTGTWSALNWCGTPELAAKALASAKNSTVGTGGTNGRRWNARGGVKTFADAVALEVANVT